MITLITIKMFKTTPHHHLSATPLTTGRLSGGTADRLLSDKLHRNLITSNGNTRTNKWQIQKTNIKQIHTYSLETDHPYTLLTSHQRHEDGLFEYPCHTLGSRRTPRNRTARCVFVFLIKLMKSITLMIRKTLFK